MTRFTHPDRWHTRVVRARSALETVGPAAALRLIVAGLRPAGSGSAAEHVDALCDYLGGVEPDVAADFGRALRELLGEAHVYPALTSSGVPGGEGFATELFGRLGRRVLPSVPEPGELRDLVRVVFDEPGDHLWVESVPDERWRRLLDTLGITAESVRGVDEELALAIRVLAHHAASLGLQPEITERLPHLEDADSPFLRLGDRIPRYLESFENEIEGDEEPLLDEALACVAACRRAVERLRVEKRLHGTSLWLTGLSYRLLTLLDRIDLLLHLTEPVERDFQGSAVRLFKEVVRAEKTRDHLVPHVRAYADLLALEVVEHAARKGSKYITSGRRDYLLFLLSSMGGGLIVAIFSLAKVLMGQWQVPLAVEAFLYGINYAICFVLIYLTGATLATKQPAMTANTLARSLGEDGHDLTGLQDLVVRVWRSQFISFVGNLIVALPVAILLAALVALGTGAPPADPAKAVEMLGDLDPLGSGSLIYAAVAGVLLFAAGLVSGWVDNWVRHRRIPRRVAHHGWLVAAAGREGASRAARVIDQKLGAIAGNVFLGFGLGSMGTVGEIIGLPLDIRHVAFASAEFGTSLEILRYEVPLSLAISIGVGVALIGLVNFVVSFGLSLLVAAESRGMRLRRAGTFARTLVRRFLRRPTDWFFPPADAPPSGSGGRDAA